MKNTQKSSATNIIFVCNHPDEMWDKPGRNDPCSCGSGKKYKKCCGDKPEARPVFQPGRQASQAGAHMTPSQQEIGVLVTAFNQQRYIEAELLARSLTASFPHYGFCWKMLGAALNKMGQSEDALLPMQKSSELSPDDADAHYHLGITLHALGRLDEAETSYRRALYIKPDFVEAFNHLSLLLDAAGNLAMALNVSIYSLKIQETAEAKSIFFSCAKRLRCTHGGHDVRAYLVRALTEPWGRPGELMQFSTDLVRLSHDIGGCMTRAVDAWPVHLSAPDLFGTNGLGTLAADTLLCALLKSAPIGNIGMERFLTMARHAMLESATGAIQNGEASASLSFCSALACQCFINDYVFSHTDDEIQKASDLRDLLVTALATKTQVPAHWLLVVASYFPLYSLPYAAQLLDTQWSGEVTAVLVQQVREPAAPGVRLVVASKI